MDELRLFAKVDKEMNCLPNNVKCFSVDRGMDFRLDTFAKVTLR